MHQRPCRRAAPERESGHAGFWNVRRGVIKCAISNIAAVALAGLLTLHSAIAQQSGSNSTVSNWQGWYTGGFAGFAWSGIRYELSTGEMSDHNSGFVGGAFLGFNYQFTGTIISGLEADISVGDLDGRIAFDQPRCSFVGRLGSLDNGDRPATFFYGLVGLTCARFEVSLTKSRTTTTLDPDFLPIFTTVTDVADANKWLWGYTVGGGFERETGWTIADRPIRWGMEYRYSAYDNWNLVFGGSSLNIHPVIQEIRLRAIVPLN